MIAEFVKEEVMFPQNIDNDGIENISTACWTIEEMFAHLCFYKVITTGVWIKNSFGGGA